MSKPEKTYSKMELATIGFVDYNDPDFILQTVEDILPNDVAEGDEVEIYVRRVFRDSKELSSKEVINILNRLQVRLPVGNDEELVVVNKSEVVNSIIEKTREEE